MRKHGCGMDYMEIFNHEVLLNYIVRNWAQPLFETLCLNKINGEDLPFESPREAGVDPDEEWNPDE